MVCFWNTDEMYVAFWIHNLYTVFLQPVAISFMPGSLPVNVDSRSSQTHSFTTQSLFSCSVSVINVLTSFSLQKRVPRLCFWFSFLCYCLLKSSFSPFIAPWIASAIYYCPIYVTQPLIKPWSLIPALALLEVSSLYSLVYSTPGHFFLVFLPFTFPDSVEVSQNFSANCRKALMLWIRS